MRDKFHRSNFPFKYQQLFIANNILLRVSKVGTVIFDFMRGSFCLRGWAGRDCHGRVNFAPDVLSYTDRIWGAA